MGGCFWRCVVRIRSLAIEYAQIYKKRLVSKRLTYLRALQRLASDLPGRVSWHAAKPHPRSGANINKMADKPKTKSQIAFLPAFSIKGLLVPLFLSISNRIGTVF